MMISKNLFLLILFAPTLSMSANFLTCDMLEQKRINAVSQVLNSDLYIVVSNALIEKRYHLNNNEYKFAKSEISLEFSRYFKKRENWNYLEIKSSGQEFFVLHCEGLKYFVMQVPLKNIQVTKLEKPVVDAKEKGIDIEGEFSDAMSQSSFDGFK